MISGRKIAEAVQTVRADSFTVFSIRMFGINIETISFMW